MIEAVSEINFFVITGDRILGWEFVIDGRLGKGDRNSLNNKQFRDHRVWEIGLRIFIDGRLGNGYRISLNNQQFIDNRGWDIGLGICDV